MDGGGALSYGELDELLGAVQFGAVVVGYDQVVRHANAAAVRIIGAGSATEIIGKSCLLHCPNESGCCPVLERGQASGVIENALLDRQGNTIPILKTITPINLDGEEVLLETFLDYAERKKTEELLKYQKTLFVSLGEASLDGILVVSPAREIAYYNQRFVKMWGIPGHVIESGSDSVAVEYVLDKLADPDAFQKRLRHLYRYCDSRSRDEIRLKDGRTFDRYTAPVMDMEGHFYGRVWYFRDITGRVNAEREVADARAFLQEVVDGIADPTMVVGLDYRVWTMNRAAREVSLLRGGRRCKTVCPVMCHEISHHIDRPCRPEDGHPCPLRDVVELKGPVTEVHEHFLPDGEMRVVEIAASPLFGPDGNVRAVVESSRDVTGRAKAEEALSRRLVMETAISRISSSLLSGRDTDIIGVLKLLGEAAGADHAYMHLFDEGHGTFSELNAWCAPGTSTDGTDLLKGLDLGGFGRWLGILKDGGEIYVHDISALPEGDSLRMLGESLGEKSLLIVPMSSGGRLQGILGFDSERDTRRWSQDDIGLVRTASGILMAYIDRRRAEDALKESEEKFRTLVEDSIAGVYILHNGCICYTNPRCAGIFGYTVDEFMGMAVMDMIHPEDRERAGRDMWEAISGRAATSYSGFRGIKKDGGIIHVEVLGSMTAYGGSPAMIGTMLDVTERVCAEALLQENERRMEHLAHHDTLTGLPNRLLFNDRLDRALALARRKGGNAAVMLFDLDRFKAINDTYGHPVGDSLLQDVAKRLSVCMRESDTFARVGGDEFCIIIPELDDIAQATSLARRVLDTGGTPYPVDGHELRVTISMGIAVFPVHGEDATALMKNADIALYRAKEDGRDNFNVYSPDAPPAGR